MDKETKTKKYLNLKGAYSNRVKRIRRKEWIANNWMSLLSLAIAVIGIIIAIVK